MMEERKLAPKKRFNNFNENWHVNKLKNIATFSKGKGYSKKDITERGTELLLYGSLYTSYKTIINTMKTYAILKGNSIISTGKEVVIPSSGETKEDIARASAIDKSGIIIGGDLNIIQPRKELNTVFLALEISHGSSQKELIKRAQGSSVVHLYNDDLKEVLIFYPTIKEQQKIGEFFKVLDERIANQERKISKVKALKEAYLTEMFPQEGETVPKRRFKGFQEEWEKMKIKDISPLRGGYGFKSDEFKESGIPILRISNILSNGSIGGNYIYTNEMEDESKFTLPNESIVIAMSGATTGKVATLQSENKKVYQNQRVGYFQPMKNINYSFISILVKTNKFTKQLNKVLVAGAQPNISSAQIDEFIFLIPNSIKEQQKIGEFFKNLDDQIRAEEAKLEKLKKMKEAYLEEMFV